MRTAFRLAWLALGALAFALGVVGLFLPIMPTVPFMLLAAFFFARSSRRLHGWLLAHPVFGPPIIDWVERGAIGRRAKLYGVASLAGSVGLGFWLELPGYALAIQAVGLGAVAVFILSRPGR